jgi:hypothetical protein
MLNQFSDGRSRIEIAASSGALRVTIHPPARWYLLLGTLVVEIVFAVMIKDVWIAASWWVRLLLSAGVCGSLAALAFEFFITQLIEISAQDLIVSKDFHGWERRQVYPINECSQMEWEPNRGESQTCGLKCKVGSRTIRFAKGLAEEESIEIIVALQKYLPDVANRICAVAKSDEHFITLGLKSYK